MNAIDRQGREIHFPPLVLEATKPPEPVPNYLTPEGQAALLAYYERLARGTPPTEKELSTSEVEAWNASAAAALDPEGAAGARGEREALLAGRSPEEAKLAREASVAVWGGDRAMEAATREERAREAEARTKEAAARAAESRAAEAKAAVRPPVPAKPPLVK